MAQYLGGSSSGPETSAGPGATEMGVRNRPSCSCDSTQGMSGHADHLTQVRRMQEALKASKWRQTSAPWISCKPSGDVRGPRYGH